MGPNLVIVLTPIFYFSPGIVKAHEPVGTQSFAAELAVEGFDEGIIGRLAGAGEVEDDALMIGPQIEIAGDEFRALINTDRLRIYAVGFLSATRMQTLVKNGAADAGKGAWKKPQRYAQGPGTKAEVLGVWIKAARPQCDALLGTCK